MYNIVKYSKIRSWVTFGTVCYNLLGWVFFPICISHIHMYAHVIYQSNKVTRTTACITKKKYIYSKIILFILLIKIKKENTLFDLLFQLIVK